MRLPEAFEDFYDRIKLSPLSEERINRAWGRLHQLLTQQFGLPDSKVYIQGSYANDTAIKPADEDGEYDLDIVAMCADPGDTADTALETLTRLLSQDEDLAQRIEPNEGGRPCVRLRYADDPEGFGFHVDVVPARGQDPQGIVEVPMRGREGWRESAPYRFTEWCQQQGTRFLRTVRFLKRWRDEHGDGSIASIVLQVLIASCLDRASTSDGEAVTNTLRGIRDFLATSPDSPPEILNPVLSSENLADRWDPDDYRKFRRELDEAVRLAEAALHTSELQASHDAWRALFGDDFPATPADVSSGRAYPPPPPPDYPDRRRQRAPRDERYG